MDEIARRDSGEEEEAEGSGECFFLGIPTELRLDIFETIIRQDDPTCFLQGNELHAGGALGALCVTSKQLRQEVHQTIATFARKEATSFRATVIDYDFTILQSLITSLAPLKDNIGRAFRIRLHFTSLTTAPDPALLETWLVFLNKRRTTMPPVSRKYHVTFDTSDLKASPTICAEAHPLLQFHRTAAGVKSDEVLIHRLVSHGLWRVQYQQLFTAAAGRDREAVG